MEDRVKLGAKAKDSITGFSGVVTAKTEYLYGCVRLLVQPTKLKDDGTVIEAQWFDEEGVFEETADEALTEVAKTTAPPGGPDRPAPASIDPE